MKKLTLAFALSLMFTPVLAGTSHGIKQDRDMCVSNDSIFCTENIQPSMKTISSGDNYLSILNTNAEIIAKNFEYKKEAFDIWNSDGFEKIKGNQKYYGDCEEYAMIAIEMAIAAGIPAERLGRIIVAGRANLMDDTLDYSNAHMIAVYYDPDQNKYFYFGDTTTTKIVESKRSLHYSLYVNWLGDNDLGWFRINNNRIISPIS